MERWQNAEHVTIAKLYDAFSQEHLLAFLYCPDWHL